MTLSPDAAALAASLPDVTTTQRLHGLQAPVDVLRDPWGIPHIRADDTDDLFFAQGFVTAQDRLWHMDADRHQALGRWAEWVGPEGVGKDRLLRAANMSAAARKDLQVCSDASRAMVAAYTAGVNAFIDSTDNLPIEYRLLGETPEPWQDWHCVAVYKIRNSLLGTFEPKLMRTRLAATIGPEATARLLRGYPKGHLVSVPPGEPFDGDPEDGAEALRSSADALQEAGADPDLLIPGAGYDIDGGSNGWSIAGARTHSGQPMVGGDSHRGLDVPNVYYQVHLTCPDFDVIGHSVPGVPGALHFCHNEYVAWGMTHGMADTQDLYVEQFRDQNGTRQYLFDGQWQDAEVRDESVRIRGEASLDLQITTTHHGPVVAGDPAAGWGIALRDPGLCDGTDWLDAALGAMRATSVAELHQAFGAWTDRVNNYAVADTSGHFGYLHEGRIPIRSADNGWAAMPGWTGQHEWDGMIAHDELPVAIDPECGWAVTCNQRVTTADYPYYVGLTMAPEHRARRVMDRIGELPDKASLDDMQAIHAERLSLPGTRFVRRLLQALGDADQPGPLAAASQGLRDWDGHIDRESAAAAIYHAARRALHRRLLEYTFGDAVELVWSAAPGADTMARQVREQMDLALAGNVRGDEVLPPGTSWDELLRDAFRAGVADLSTALGDDPAQWSWGRLHRSNPTHALSGVFAEWADLLNPPGHELHGDADTPLAGSFGLGSFAVTALSVNRYLFDPSDWTTACWIVPGGSSGHPGSPHYADQAPLHASVEYIPALWDAAQIDQQAETRQRLEPTEP